MRAKLFNLTRDEKGRPVLLHHHNGKTAAYYMGPDAHGIIHSDTKGEYVLFHGEKRYWRGVILEVPEWLLRRQHSDVGLLILKPDVFQRALEDRILAELPRIKLEVIRQRFLQFTPGLVYQLYPFFFTPEWEYHLVQYMTSGPSLILVVRGPSVTLQLLGLRALVRERYTIIEQHPVYNLVHSPDTSEEAMREIVLLFGVDEAAQLLPTHT